jgi:peptidoglycan hydrolase CwlO-like protein
VESRFQSLETKTKDLQLCSVDLDKKSTDLQANIGDLQVRTESLEQKWENHVTTFLQATSIVVSFERELAHLKDVMLARDGASSSDANREMTPLKGKLDAGEDL